MSAGSAGPAPSGSPLGGIRGHLRAPAGTAGSGKLDGLRQLTCGTTTHSGASRPLELVADSRRRHRWPLGDPVARSVQPERRPCSACGLGLDSRWSIGIGRLLARRRQPRQPSAWLSASSRVRRLPDWQVAGVVRSWLCRAVRVWLRSTASAIALDPLQALASQAAAYCRRAGDRAGDLGLVHLAPALATGGRDVLRPSWPDHAAAWTHGLAITDVRLLPLSVRRRCGLPSASRRSSIRAPRRVVERGTSHSISSTGRRSGDDTSWSPWLTANGAARTPSRAVHVVARTPPSRSRPTRPSPRSRSRRAGPQRSKPAPGRTSSQVAARVVDVASG